MRHTTAKPVGTRSASAPKMEAPQAMRKMADKGATELNESYKKMSAATAEVSSLMQNADSAAAQGAMDCNTKVMEFARANSNAAFGYAQKILGVKSLSEFFEVSTEHAHRQFELLSAQTKELTALSQKVMLETAQPFQTGAAKAFRGPLA